jgi:hypothetical protein
VVNQVTKALGWMLHSCHARLLMGHCGPPWLFTCPFSYTIVWISAIGDVTLLSFRENVSARKIMLIIVNWSFGTDVRAHVLSHAKFDASQNYMCVWYFVMECAMIRYSDIVVCSMGSGVYTLQDSGREWTFLSINQKQKFKDTS